MTQRILVVDDSPINLHAATLALEEVGYEVITANDGREALERAQADQPDMIILDVQMPELDGYEVCRRLRRLPDFMNRPIMMLTANNELQERVQGLEAGADDYMAKPFEAEELQARVKAMLRRAAAMQAAVTAATAAPVVTGKTIALFSLRGGVGVSSLAANLAAGLAQLWGGKTALVDMVFTGGHAAMLLNLPLRTTWGDLAGKATDELDIDVIERVMLDHPSGVRLMAASLRPDQNEAIGAEKVTAVLNVLRRNNRYVVLDLPHNFSEPTLAALDLADQIVLLLAPEIASVVSATCALDVFEQLGYGDSKVTLVLNAPFERGALARKDIERALKRPLASVIPFAGDMFVSALNRGAPPVVDMPTKPLGALLEDWAFGFSSEDDTRTPPEKPTPALQRVSQRLQQRRKARG